MDYFLQTFGEITIGSAAVFICAIAFLATIIGKTGRYITEKILAKKKEDDQIQEVTDQSKKYPEWHKQSIEIQEQYDNAFKNLESKLDAVDESIKELRKENAEDRATNCRYRIFRFNDEILHDQRHTKEHFDQILEDITEYEKYCEEHPDYENNKAVLAVENIERVYRQCNKEGSFL